MDTFLTFSLAAVLIVAVMGMYLAVLAGLLFGIAWCFEFDMSWKIVFGVWMVFVLFNLAVKGFSSK